MIALERKRYILNALKEKGIINLREIAKELNMAEITIRRDFEKLEAEGKLKRVQGGATIGEDSQNEQKNFCSYERKRTGCTLCCQNCKRRGVRFYRRRDDHDSVSSRAGQEKCAYCYV